MDDAYIYQGDNYHHCVDCGLVINFGDMVFRGKWGYRCYTCQYYFDKRKTMPNIKITAEVDGKQVPLNTISTESFEAIKALEKPKEIPVARLATYAGSPRLLLRMTQNIIDHIKFGRILAIDPVSGGVAASWKRESDDSYHGSKNYRSIKPVL